MIELLRSFKTNHLLLWYIAFCLMLLKISTSDITLTTYAYMLPIILLRLWYILQAHFSHSVNFQVSFRWAILWRITASAFKKLFVDALMYLIILWSREWFVACLALDRSWESEVGWFQMQSDSSFWFKNFAAHFALQLISKDLFAGTISMIL